jgi:hypothetical protein
MAAILIFVLFSEGTGSRLRARMCAWFAVAWAAATPGWALVISEIHYHPPSGQESLEFIELTNDAFSPEDISGWAFVEGIRFVIPPGTVLRGGESIALCADVAAVQAHYDPRRAIGDYTGSLDAAGERLTLVNHAGALMQTLRYRDRGDWSVAADGAGHSLILTNIHADSSDARHWTHSPELGGSPSEANFFADRIGFRDERFFDFDPPWRYRRGTESFSEPPEAWRESTFDDSGWATGLPGFGFGDDDDTTVLEDMEGNYTSVAVRLRVVFSEADLNDLTLPVLEMGFDDGFCAFVNGIEFARVNCPSEFVWDSLATDGHESRDDFRPLFEIPRKALQVGENVLAIVGYNRTQNDRDFSLHPRLLLRRFDEVPLVERAEVVLNELFRGADGDSWVELFNAEIVARDVSGWALADGIDGMNSYKLPDGTTIGPGRFLVVGEAESGLSLSAPEVALFLRSPTGVVLEAVVFDRAFSGGPTYAEARSPDGGPERWVTTTPTPLAPNDVPVLTDLVINEIFYNPPEGRAGEFIELYHRGLPLEDGGAALDLSGFRFTEGIDYTFPGGVVVSPGGYVVVAEDPGLLAENYGLRDALGPFQGALANSGERVRLVDALGNLVDEVRYDDGGDWPVWADAGGSSIELIDPDQPNDVAAAWSGSDETQKAPWEEHVFTILDPVRANHPELRFFLLERGVCLVDAVRLTTPVKLVEPLVDSGVEWLYREGTRPFSEPADAWYGEAFDDSGWQRGASGFGYGDDDDRTVLEFMRGGYSSLAIRRRIDLTPELLSSELGIGLNYDDGFCAFVNGQLIVCDNVPDVVEWSATAPRSHEASGEEFFEIPDGILRSGENTVAILGLNRTLNDSDFTLDPRLLKVTGVGETESIVPDGNFEADPSPWTFRGTHQQSERFETDSFSGAASLRVVATSKGDGQCNGTEIELDSPLEAGQTYLLSLATKWQRGGSLLFAGSGFGGAAWPALGETNLSGTSIGAPVRLAVPHDLGTPGKENSVRLSRREQTGADNLGPVFTEVIHDPPVPDPGMPVTIRARVLDSDGVGWVRVLFRLGASESAELTELDLSSVGDGLYRVELPPTGEPDRVLFYLEAGDDLGVVGTYPIDGPRSPLVYRSDPERTEALHITTASQAFNPGGLMSNELVNGTVIHHDEVFYNVGMRYRGSPWGRQIFESVRLRFPKDRLFKGSRREVNVSIRDRQTDGAAHFTISRNGTPEHPAPASDYKYISTRLNGVGWELPGIFEPYGRTFIAKWFGRVAAERGVLLKANGRISFEDNCTEWVWDGASAFHRGGIAENHRFYYTHSMNQSRDNWEPFNRLTRVLDASVTDVEGLDEGFASVLDFESFSRTLGPRIIANDADALFVANGHNGYIFWDPTEDLWHYIGMDFGGWNLDVNRDLLGSGEPNIARLLSRPKPSRLYYNMVNDYVHGYLDPVVSLPYFSAVFELTGFSSAGRSGIARSDLLAILQPFVEAPFRILGGDGGDLIEVDAVEANASAVTLRGEAPVTMNSFLLQEDGGQAEEFEPEFTSPTEWIATIGVGGETQVVQILGFDRDGALIGATSVTVVVSGASEFVRGDVDGDSRISLRDPLAALAALFRGGSLSCADAADVNDDGRIDVTDVLTLLEFIFAKGSSPLPPFPAAGPDPSEDEFGCQR